MKEPTKCEKCGSDSYYDKITDFATENTVCEKERYCLKCGSFMGYWEYGHWKE